MGIKMTTPEQTIAKFAIECERITHDYVIMALSRMGEECVTRIRNRSNAESWIDRTGNLRSSIGYLVLDSQHVVVESGFDASFGIATRKTKVEFVTKDGKQVSFFAKTPGGGPEGAKAGRIYAQSLIQTYSNGYVLLVVAGMNYAESVEARDNKDVLRSTELWARKEWVKRAQSLKNNLEKAFDRTAKNLGLA